MHIIKNTSPLRLLILLLVLLAACLLLRLYPQPEAAPLHLPSVVGERVNVDDITIYYEQYGKGEPILFLHGGLGSANSWANQLAFFSKKYRVVTPDSRGQGRTTDGQGPISYHQMAEDMLKLMDKLHIQKAYVVGWSDGGNIGIDLAVHHPERLHAVVAYGANINPAGLRQDFFDYLEKTTPEQRHRDLSREYLSVSPTPKYAPVIVDKIVDMWVREPKFTLAELASIKVPVLVIDGEQEEAIREGHAAEIAAAIPKSTLVLLPNVGHYAVSTMPDKWNSVVANFLETAGAH